MKLRSFFLRSCLLALTLASSPAQGAQPTFNGKVTASRNLADRIDVTWTALYNATSVTIWRGGSEYFSSATPVATVSVSGAGTWTQGTWSDTTAVVMSASYFTEFHYWIEAKNADGSTLEQGKHDKGYRNPGDPGNPSITVHPGGSTTGVDLSWTKADYAVTYEIYRSATEAGFNAGTATKIGTVSGTSSNLTFTDSGTEPGVEYWYAVNAVNPSGVGRGNHGCSYRAVSFSRSPSSFSLTSASQSRTVTITANASWTVGKPSGASWLTLGSTSGSGSGSFSFSVAKNTEDSPRETILTLRAGLGTAHPKSAAITVSQAAFDSSAPTSAPSAPTGVSASDGTYTDRIRVSWNASEGAASYDVYRAQSVYGEKAVVATTLGTSIDDTSSSVFPGMTYYYWVVAKNVVGSSYFSDHDTGWKKIHNIAPFSVFRFYSKAYKGHFFTIDEAEKNNLVANNPNWTYEGVAYRAFKEQASGTVALYRFYSKNYRGHFFTVDPEEAETVKKNPNWNYEGIAYYVLASPDEITGAVPVYRFWSKAYRHHFYTTNEAEKDDLIANNPNWSYEGIAFYALPEEGPSPAPKANAQSTMQNARCAAPFGGDSADDSDIDDDEDNTGSIGNTGNTDVTETLAPWALAANAQCEMRNAQCPAADGCVPVAVPGETAVGDLLVEVRTDAPDAEELMSGGAGVPPAAAARSESSPHLESHCALSITHCALCPEGSPQDDAVALRLSLPDGVFDAALWSAAEGMVAEEAAEGGFDFELPANGVWHWLRVRDAEGGDAFSVWLRAAVFPVW